MVDFKLTADGKIDVNSVNIELAAKDDPETCKKVEDFCAYLDAYQSSLSIPATVVDDLNTLAAEIGKAAMGYGYIEGTKDAGKAFVSMMQARTQMDKIDQPAPSVAPCSVDIKPAKGFFRWVWFEEFSELPGENFVRSVMQSVGRGGKPVVFRSFNPPVSLNNWANKFIQQPNEEALTLHTDYIQVPPEWLGEVFLNEAQRIQSLNPKVYEHEYLGIPTGSGGEVFTTLEVREIADEELAMQCYRYVGCDFGFASDPAAVVALYYDRSTETIYFADEIYKRGLSNEALAAEIRAHGLDHVGEPRKNPITGAETAPEQVIYCDCAEPKSVHDLREYGLQARPCIKRPGCVNYRIKWLQKRTLVVDPKRTPNVYREFSQSTAWTRSRWRPCGRAARPMSKTTRRNSRERARPAARHTGRP